MSGSRERSARGPVDWTEIRRRVETAAATSSGKESLTPEKARAILSERARALARPLSSPGSEEGVEVVVFTLGGETYAVESRYVMEVFRVVETTPLPGVAPPVVAVAAWRGELLVLLDLRTAAAAPRPSAPGLVLVLGEERAALGLLVEEVEELIRLAPGETHRLPEDGAGTGTWVSGITRDAILVLDGGELMRTHR